MGLNHTFGFKCSDDTYNKMKEIMRVKSYQFNSDWFEEIVNREYETINNDRKHIDDIKFLISILDSMLIFEQAYDNNRKRVNDSIKAIDSLKSYLIKLDNLETEDKE